MTEIACDMSTAEDTPAERRAEYARLFAGALRRRERRADGVRFTFGSHARAAVEDLALREAACCPFLESRVEVVGDAVVWTITSPVRGDDRAAVEALLDEFHALPDAR
jgi:hypothetical protein